MEYYGATSFRLSVCYALQQAAAMKAEAAGAIRRIEMDTSALDTRAELLAPKFQALEEGRTALDLARKEGGWNPVDSSTM